MGFESESKKLPKSTRESRSLAAGIIWHKLTRIWNGSECTDQLQHAPAIKRLFSPPGWNCSIG